MKRILVVVFMLVFTLAFNSAMSEEEFYSGFYKVGQDIKEGSYNIKLERVGNGEAVAVIKVWDSEEDFSNGKFLYSFTFGLEGVHLFAKEGMVFGIVVKDGDGKLTIVPDRPSWMPQ